ncbi:MAG TPA: hypothetical protein VMT76_08330 [Puia sp.]|nr:hypothetical protein [Puia sp.]
MKRKITVFSFLLLFFSGLWISSCKKNSSAPKTTNTSNFWYGNIYGTNNFKGPGNAILLRNDGTMREYANDYYSAATTMGAGDTATAKIKIDGTYVSINTNGNYTVYTTWYVTSSATTYTTTGVISGNTMTGSFKDSAAGGTTVATFSFTNAN